MLTNRVPLNLDLTINSGQVFLWDKIGNSWYGVYGDNIVKASMQGDGTRLAFGSYPDHLSEKQIFRLDDDLAAVTRSISKDGVMRDAISKFGGLRLMRQEPYQCLVSFICATNTSIAMIRRMLSNLCARFGKEVEFDGRRFHLFPEPRRIADASINELWGCSLGYRSRFVRQAARMVRSGSIDLESLKRIGYEDAKEELMDVLGIGHKVADCIMLFSLDKLEAFPVDVWIARAVAGYYGNLLEESIKGKIVSPRTYRMVSSGMREYFGDFAGYANQYLYCYARDRLKPA